MLTEPHKPYQKLCEANLVQISYRICYQETEGYILLSHNKIRIIAEKLDTYTKALELPYEHITAITSEARHLVTIVDNKNQSHRVISRSGVTAYLIEADLKSRIAPLDYPQQG